VGVDVDDVGAIRESLTTALEPFLGLSFTITITVEPSSDVDD